MTNSLLPLFPGVISIPILAVFGAFGLFACVDASPPPVRMSKAPAVVGLVSDHDVPLTGVVTIALTNGVERDTNDWPIVVTREDGAETATFGDTVREPPVIDVHPLERWPAGETLLVEIKAGFVDEEGQALVPPTSNLRFRTRAEERAPPGAEVIYPVPGQTVPSNTSIVVVRLSESSTPPPRLALRSRDDVVWATHETTGERRQASYRLSLREGRCSTLCPDAVYSLRTADETLPFPLGPRGEVRTSSLTDDEAPRILRHDVVRGDIGLWFEVEANEPVLLKGRIESADEDPGANRTGALLEDPVPMRMPRATTAGSLESDREYRITFWVEDAASHRSEAITTVARTWVRTVVQVREIVASPLRDWGDSQPNGVPFDDQPGSGGVTDADEWIELVNLSDRPIDLRDTRLSLVTRDASPSITELASAPNTFFGSGGDVRQWWPGEALVVRPRGQMSQKDLHVEVHTPHRMLDSVHVGPGGAHPGGPPPDLVYEAIARDDLGRFRWCRPTPGDAAPGLDCRDP